MGLFTDLASVFGNQQPKVELDNTAKDRIGPTIDRHNTTTDGALRYIFRDKFSKNVLAGANEFYGEIIKVINDPAQYDWSEYNESNFETAPNSSPLSNRYKVWLYGRIFEIYTKPKKLGSDSDTDPGSRNAMESLPDAVASIDLAKETDFDVGDKVIVTFSNLETFSGMTIIRRLSNEKAPKNPTDTPRQQFETATPQKIDGSPVTPPENNTGKVADDRQADGKAGPDGLKPGDTADMMVRPLGPFKNVSDPPEPKRKKGDPPRPPNMWYIPTKFMVMDPGDYNTQRMLASEFYVKDFIAFKQTAKDAGVKLWTNDGVRSQERQDRLYQKYIKGDGNLANKADGIFRGGHGNGSAFDIGGNGGFESANYSWMYYNAAKFNLYNNGRTFYPQRESWHWQYVTGLKDVKEEVVLKRYEEATKKANNAYQKKAEEAEKGKKGTTGDPKFREKTDAWRKQFAVLEIPKRIVRSTKHE